MNKQEIERAIDELKQQFRNSEGCVVNGTTIEMAISALEKQLTNGWIPVSERLPEESIDGITDDFLPYNVSLKFKYGECVRTYQFGQGRWWKNGDDMTAYVIAWQPLPEPWKETI